MANWINNRLFVRPSRREGEDWWEAQRRVERSLIVPQSWDGGWWPDHYPECVYEFRTKWSPPLEDYQRLSAAHPDCQFDFKFDNTYELAMRGMGWLRKGTGEVYETDGSGNPYAKLYLIDKNGLRQVHPAPA